MRRLPSRIAAAAVLFAGVAGQDALAQSDTQGSADMPASCEVKGESADIRLLLCADDLDQEALVMAGRSACGSHLPCGAWIWTQEADIPETAPEAHDGLTPEQVSSAKVVWIAEMQNLITIEELTK